MAAGNRAFALPLLTFPAQVERLIENFKQVGAGPGDLVMDRNGTAVSAEPTRARDAQHHEAGDVGGVGMELKVLVGHVAAPLLAVGVYAKVPHVAKHVAPAALRHGCAHVQANAPVHQAQVILCVFFCGQAAHHEETETGFKLLQHTIKRRPKRLKREIFLGQRFKGLARPSRRHQRLIQRCQLRGGQVVNPLGRVFQVFGDPAFLRLHTHVSFVSRLADQ